MKQLFTILLLSTLILGLKAEKQMLVLKTDGLSNSIGLNDIQKITYPKDSVKVHYSNGSVVFFHLDNISQIKYSDEGAATKNMVPPITTLTIKAYPNPFDNIINIEFVAEKNTKTQIQIVDLNGKTVYRGQAISHQGENTVSINTNHLKSGSYFCCLSTENDTKTMIILKR